MKPPGSLSELQRRINAYAIDTAQPYDRAQRRAAVEVMFNVFERAREKGVIEAHVFKGGMALEVRFDLRARASKDLDVSLPIPVEAIAGILPQILACGFDDFTLHIRDEPRHFERVNVLRFGVQILYKRRNFFSIDLDVSAMTREPAVDRLSAAMLPHIGLPGPITIPILDDATQLAHKLHAATEILPPPASNERYRDVLDALMLFEGFTTSDCLNALRVTCRAEFSARGTHPWPPALADTAAWRSGLEEEAQRHGSSVTHEPELRAQFERMIERIEGSASSGTRSGQD
jgi:hypothetical protein